ncbi:MAG: DUF4113 domain-containing protein [Burkholderiales bacterium]|nr:DUF4113 domain-containing protein [Nitrosomonas sp.]MCP5275485.1 DUF4113 domain-containing protein [Burkholderiales bacterium]
MKRIYRPGYRYGKAGVILMNLIPAGMQQTTLFTDDTTATANKTQSLTETIDLINRRMGKDTLSLAGAGIVKNWHMKQRHKSPCYTTVWKELASAYCH